MNVTQTVEIPVNHRLIIDVPPEVPAGQADIIFFPKEVPKSGERSGFGCSKGKYRMAEDFDEPLEDLKDYM